MANVATSAFLGRRYYGYHPRSQSILVGYIMGDIKQMGSDKISIRNLIYFLPPLWYPFPCSALQRGHDNLHPLFYPITCYFYAYTASLVQTSTIVLYAYTVGSVQTSTIVLYVHISYSNCQYIDPPGTQEPWVHCRRSICFVYSFRKVK